MTAPKSWDCPQCQSEQIHDAWCEQCGKPRFQSWDVMVSEHVLEHIADGLSTPLDIQKAMNARPCYKNIRGGFELDTIARRIRLLTKDTTKLAHELAKARAASVTLDVLETGEHKDKIAVLKGWGVMTDTVKHEGEMITRHVVELHDGPPPKQS